MTDFSRLRRVNLNLLPVLRCLLTLRSVSRTAEELNLTQSAISISLRKLRAIFDDELLVVRGREMVLTRTAEQLIAPLEAFASAAEALVETPAFDPATAQRVFTIVSADYVTALLTPQLLPRLNRIAPNIGVQVVIGGALAGRDMQQGVVDLMIAPPRISDWLGIEFADANGPYDYEVVLRDRLVCIAAIADTSVGDTLDIETYRTKRHATFCLSQETHANVELDTLQRLGVSQSNQVLVQEYTLLPMIVAATHSLSVVPETIAKVYEAAFPIRRVEPPIAFDPISLVMVWAKSHARDPGLSWFRQEVRSAFAQYGTNAG